jgi:glycosyltransferase
VKREIFEKYGLYDTSYAIASDYEISLRWFTNPAISKHFMNRYLVKMRLGGKSTSPGLQKKKSAEDFRIIQKYRLWWYLTLSFKIGRKIPQYILPYLQRTNI